MKQQQLSISFTFLLQEREKKKKQKTKAIMRNDITLVASLRSLSLFCFDF